MNWVRLRMEFVRNNLRRVSVRWPAAGEAKRKARTARKVNPSTGRLAWHARCGGCFQELPEGKLEMDHVDPVVPVDRDYSVDAYSEEQLGRLVTRLLPAPEGYQGLCRECHAAKTAREQEKRAALRKAAKESKRREQP